MFTVLAIGGVGRCMINNSTVNIRDKLIQIALLVCIKEETSIHMVRTLMHDVLSS